MLSVVHGISCVNSVSFFFFWFEMKYIEYLPFNTVLFGLPH